MWVVGDGDVCDKPVKEVKSLTFTPELQDAESADLTQKFAEYVTKAAQFSRACEEALTEMLVTGIAGTIIMGFMWVIFLRLFACLIVYLALTVLVVTLLIITVVCYVRAGWTPNPDDFFNSTDITPNLGEYNYENLATTDNRTAYAVMAVIMTILLAIVLIMLAMWRKCISRCIAIIRESTKVFKTIPSMMVWPLVSIVFLTATYFWAFLVAAYIFYVDEDTYAENLDKLQKAIEEYSSGDAASHLDSDPSTQKWVLFWVHIFGVLWVVEFIRACTWITMSGAVCWWYFFKEDAEKYEKFPLLSSCKRVLCYHLGSAAFGALIIAICQLIRYMLATLDYYTKDYQKANLIFKLAIKCSQCATWCLQKTIEFVSYFGFVYIALNGTSFCASCKETFKFLLTPKNAMQTAVNKVVEKLIILIIAWTTPTFTSLICYAWLSGNDEYTADNNPLYPCIIVWVGSFALAGAIATVFECTIDTIFLCSFRDAAMFNGKYMSVEMKEGFGISSINEKEMEKMGLSAVQTSADYKKHREDADKKQAEGTEPTIKA